jgi:large subunit ribosomal protein L11
MAKEVTGYIKLQVKGAAANPAPPIGPALGSKGVNIMEFCKQFNARTQDKSGKTLPVVITVYADKSFEFIIKHPPVAAQLKEMAEVPLGPKGAAKGPRASAEPNRKKVGNPLSWSQIKTIATNKMPDLNAFTIQSAMRTVAGTARSMGIEIKGEFPKEI